MVVHLVKKFLWDIKKMKMSKEETLKSVQKLRSSYKLVNELFDESFNINFNRSYKEKQIVKTSIFAEVFSLLMIIIFLPIFGIFIVISSLLTLSTIPLVVIYAYLQKLYSIYFLKRKRL